MYSYGWRDYMPDIARWHGIDQLAKSYFSTSTYAYVANNPISNTDPDGRWIYEDGSIGQGPATWDMAGPKYKPAYSYQNNFLGVTSTDGGGGNYLAFGQTQAYANLMAAFYAGGTGGLINQNGYYNYWTSSAGFVTINADGEKETNLGEMTNYVLKLSGLAVFGVGVAGTGMELRGAFNSQSMYSQGVRQGLNGSSYVLTGRNARLFAKAQPTTATLPISKVGKFGKGLGYGSFGAGLFIDGVGVYNYMENPKSDNAVHPAKAATNTGIGAWGLWGGPYGVIVSTVYGAFEAFYPGGLEGAMNHNVKFQSELNNGVNKAGPYRVDIIPRGPK